MESGNNKEKVTLSKVTGLVGHSLTPQEIKRLKEERERIVKENQLVKK